MPNEAFGLTFTIFRPQESWWSWEVNTRLTDLPSITSILVKKQIKSRLQAENPEDRILSLDECKDIRHDTEAGVRIGRCVMKSDKHNAMPLQCVVRWVDRASGEISIECEPEVPFITTPELTQLIDEHIRKSLAGFEIHSIDDFRELDYDIQSKTRHGSCVVHIDFEDITYHVFVKWADENQSGINFWVEAKHEK